MSAFSEFLSHLKTLSIVFVTLLVLEIIILVRSVTGFSSKSDKRKSTSRYLKHIEEKYPTARYKRRLTTEQTECAVCLSEFEEGEKIRNLGCKHMFHKDCLDLWLQQCRATCPLCRTKALPDDVVASFHGAQNQVEYDGGDEEVMFLLSALHGTHRFS